MTDRLKQLRIGASGPARRSRCAGQVLVIVLLGIGLLGGLIFYVINTGDQVNHRLAMQNAADSTSISGAAWMARSMNVIASNNVAITRMLALVPHLDSFPLATKMAHSEVAAWERCMDRQLDRGVPDDWMRDGLESLRKRMARQRDILAPMNDLFNNSAFDMDSLTYWAIRGHSGPPPHGRLWQAAESLDELSQATAMSAGPLSQANAVRYGQKNYAETAFVVPVMPELPARRTSFGDFKKPVKNGIIPDRDYPHRLGPYDRLFKWRRYHSSGVYERDRWVEGNPGHGAIRGSRGNVNIGGRRQGRSARGYSSNPDGHWSHRITGRMITGYSVYGPYTWMMQRVGRYRELPDTYFYDYYRRIAGIKLGYMWGSQELKKIHYPQWVTDYPEARAQAAGGARVTRTMFYLVEIRSKYPKGGSGWLSKGSYKTNGKRPIAIWVNGWADPDKWGVSKIADYIWEDQYFYETTEDREIGINKQLDENNKPIWQKVYMVAQYVFGGIDVGGETPVYNPTNYSDRDDLPAPILIDTSAGDYDMSQPHHDLGVRRDVFSYLGIAFRSNRPTVWPGRFGSGNPFGKIVAVSQSEIFNTTSWDLWTQDWKAKTVPVTRWGDWVDRITAGIEQAPSTGGMVDAETVRDVGQYFGRFDEDMVAEMMHH